MRTHFKRAVALVTMPARFFYSPHSEHPCRSGVNDRKVVMRRRSFLQTSLAASLAATLPRVGFAAESDAVAKYRKTIGLQLWTVRNQLAEDKVATLQAVKDAGYAQVELGNVTENVETATIARDLGLDVTSSFMNWATLGNPSQVEAGKAPSTDKVLETTKQLGLKHLVFGYIGRGHRETADHFKAHAAAANTFGEECKAAGIQLCYHNHSFEFGPINGAKNGFEVLVEEFDGDLCPFELDVFWAAIGGYDAVETLGRLKGRVSQVHLKDLKAGVDTIFDEGKVPKDAFQELGDGRLKMAAIMEAADKAGAVQCHVEQDQSPNPLKSIKQSHQWLQQA